MTNLWGSAGGSDQERTTIRTCATYEEAQRCVDFLSDHEFAVAGVQIVGRDLQMVETVTGRMSYGRAAAAGMAGGAWFGLLIGILLGFFANPDKDPSRPSLLILGLLWGAVFGIVYGLLGHAATRGRRDFSSRSKLVADQYDVTSPPALAQQARDLLAQLPVP